MIDTETLVKQLNDLQYAINRHECEEGNFESRLYCIERDIHILIARLQQLETSLDLLNQTAILAEITK